MCGTMYTKINVQKLSLRLQQQNVCAISIAP